ncbi:uncharacterized protein LOC134232495 isoform X2 [Saccostrea cucullata]|uniref:uncharacterized protein LOC134232495 isoform X2 n=1 Tax=Saccostrea cuccullata TaxID=36930 RepID=UPI002ED600A3
MERLVNICLLLALIFVRISLQYAFNVTVTPNIRKIFYSDFVKEPKNNITCKSNCANCRHSWEFYEEERHVKTVRGKVLFLSNIVVRRKYSLFFCRVSASFENYTDSPRIEVIIQEIRPTTLTPSSVSMTQPSFNTVNSNSTSVVKSDDSFLFIVTGISGVAFLIITVIVVGILCLRANKKSTYLIKNDTTQKKDPALELTENVLDITADDVPEMPPSAPSDNDTTASDVYAVVNKENKNVNQIPTYAEVRTSQKGKDNQKTEKKSDEKGENNPGQSANKDGMVYIEIDFNDKPSNGNAVLHGAEDKILYVDIDSVKHADPLPKNEGEGNHDSQQNGEK